MKWTIDIDNLQEKNVETLHFEQEEVCVGRLEQNDIVLNTRDVSRRHLILYHQEGKVYIKDLNSRNGTCLFRNGSHLFAIADRQTLESGDQVKVAKHTIITVNWEDDAEYHNTLAYDDDDDETRLETSLYEDRCAEKQTIMVLDLCDSSGLAFRDNVMALNMKDRLDNISQPILETFKQGFYKNTGDGFVALFAEAGNAINASIKLLHTLKLRNSLTKNPAIHVRCAIHYGDIYKYSPILEKKDLEDIHGNDVNIAFRIEGIQEDGFRNVLKVPLPINNRILCSKALQEKLILENKPDNESYTMKPLGEAKMKGIEQTVFLFLVEPKV